MCVDLPTLFNKPRFITVPQHVEGLCSLFFSVAFISHFLFGACYMALFYLLSTISDRIMITIFGKIPFCSYPTHCSTSDAPIPYSSRRKTRTGCLNSHAPFTVPRGSSPIPARLSPRARLFNYPWLITVPGSRSIRWRNLLLIWGWGGGGGGGGCSFVILLLFFVFLSLFEAGSQILPRSPSSAFVSLACYSVLSFISWKTLQVFSFLFVLFLLFAFG